MRTFTPIKTYIPQELVYDNAFFEPFKLKNKAQKKNPDESILAFLNNFQFVEKLEEASLVWLPMDWNYYFQNNKEQEAIAFVNEASQLGLVIWSSTSGDFGISQQLPDNCWIYRTTGYRSKMTRNEKIFPFYLSDPIKAFFEGQEDLVLKRSIQEKPIVGFCGMAPTGNLLWQKEKVKIAIRNILGNLGLHPFDAQAVLSSSKLRVRALKQFEDGPNFRSNYIIREKYRAGANDPETRKKTTREYYQNQYESDFIICVRGGGNFSVRFYETLAMGRIPIFVDTDSPLPDISPLSWSDYVVICPVNQLEKLPQITLKWMADKEIMEVRKKNRQLWKEHLSLMGFWNYEVEKFVKNQ